MNARFKKLTELFTVLTVSGAVMSGITADSAPTEAEVRVSEQPQVQTFCGQTPVKRFGFCWVLGEAPTLLDDTPLQKGYIAPRVKVHPKDSSQIKGNHLGVTTSRMARSTANDYLPVEAIRLIDRVTDCA